MSEQLPAGAKRIADRHPEIWQAYTKLGAACADAGPLDAKTRRLVKLALAVGTGSQGAVHSHVRRGLDEDVSEAELKHVALLAISTLGLPKAVAALTWIEDVTDPGLSVTYVPKVPFWKVSDFNRLDLD